VKLRLLAAEQKAQDKVLAGGWTVQARARVCRQEAERDV